MEKAVEVRAASLFPALWAVGVGMSGVRGGHATIVEVRRTDDGGDEYVAKVFSQLPAAFRAEVWAANAVGRHPRIVAIEDAFADPGGARPPVVVLRKAAGSLDRLKRLVRAPWQLFAIAVDLLEAVQHCHGRGVCHCDIKPANVLVYGDPLGGFEARLSDFGLASRVDRRPAVVCTPAYRPRDCDRADLRSVDAWSLGVTLAEVAIGHH